MMMGDAVGGRPTLRTTTTTRRRQQDDTTTLLLAVKSSGDGGGGEVHALKKQLAALASGRGDVAARREARLKELSAALAPQRAAEQQQAVELAEDAPGPANVVSAIM